MHACMRERVSRTVGRPETERFGVLLFYFFPRVIRVHARKHQVVLNPIAGFPYYICALSRASAYTCMHAPFFLCQPVHVFPTAAVHCMHCMLLLGLKAQTARRKALALSHAAVAPRERPSRCMLVSGQDA